MENVYVVGFGGNGQTYIMEKLSEYMLVNSPYNKDRLKHLIHPLDKRTTNFDKILFVYSDCFSSICSHFRRGWLYTHLSSMGKYKIEWSGKNINKYFQIVEKEKKCKLPIYQQFENFLEYSQKPIYFFDITNYQKEKKILDSFLGVETNFKLKKRTSYYEYQIKYPLAHNIYKKLYTKITEKAYIHNKQFDI